MQLVRSSSLVAGVVVIASVGCKSNHHTEAEPASGAMPVASRGRTEMPQEIVIKANDRIKERQRAIKAWASVEVPDAGDCARAPAAPATQTDGFRMASTEAKKTMEIISAAELAGAPDPSMSPDIAADLAKVNAAGRNMGSNEWVQMDYTSDEFPFRAGPIASAFQLEAQTFAMGESRKKPAEILALLAGSELVLVVDAQRRTDVNREAHTFTAGAMAGTALLWSYDDHRVVCAGHFNVTNHAKEFEASEAQLGGMPQDELELQAFHDAALHLHAVK